MKLEFLFGDKIDIIVLRYEGGEAQGKWAGIIKE